MPCGHCIASLGDASLPCPICGEGIISLLSSTETSTRNNGRTFPESYDSPYQQNSTLPQIFSDSEEQGDALETDAVNNSGNAKRLPGRMREILRYLKDDLMVSWSEAANAVCKRRAYNLKKIEDAWNARRSKHDRLQADIRNRLDAAKQTYDRSCSKNTRALDGVINKDAEMRVALLAMENEATFHMTSQKIDIPYLPSQAPSNVRASGHMEKAENQFAIASVSLAQLKEIKRPKYWCWTANDLAIVIPIALLSGLTISIAVKAEGFGVLLWSFILISFGILGPIGVMRRGIVIARTTSIYGKLAQAKQSVEFWLLQYVRQAREEHQQANAAAQRLLSNAEEDCRRKMAAEDHSFSEAQKEHQQAEAAEEIRYQRDLFECRRTFDSQMEEARRLCDDYIADTGFAGADWKDEWSHWSPPAHPSLCLRVGRLSAGSINVSPLCEPGEVEFSIPAITSFLEGHSLLFRYGAETKKQVTQSLQAIMLRMLATIPPGKIRFTFIDPVGLGQTVAAFMALGDYEESLINSRAWTEAQHIEQRLNDLTEHMETVIQKYLRNEFATIEEYNAQAQVAEPYRALVVVDFPVNFSETAARRLVSIAQNGPRCGVHTFIAADASKPPPYGFNISDLEQMATVITWDGHEFVCEDDELRKYTLELDQPPDGNLSKEIIKVVGERAKSAMKVEVPYVKLLQMAELTEPTWWENKSAEKIRIPLGPMGARKLQYLSLGESTAHHTLVVGRPGSGKSNLMHVIITTLALAYPPEEMQLYLIDFKKGVEFNDYAEMQTPHALVIAIESEREFGLSVLQRLDEELQKRGEAFRDSGVNSIVEYRNKNAGAEIPRTLLLVDEFQEFFTQDDNISREANLILDRLVRQGRAFGIHVMLGSQTLAGSYSLSRSTLDQMAVRIALQCSEADSRLILADDNPAARLLSRPGEAIYNAASGLVEGNSLFQVAMFTKEDRMNYLSCVNKLAKASGRNLSTPIIFEGKKPARLEDCKPLNEMIDAGIWPQNGKAYEAFLGEPIAIQQPTKAGFSRRGGSHLLIVARNEEEGTGMLASAVISLAIQQPPADAKFFIVDFSSADSPWANLFENMAGLLPHYIQVLGRRDLPALLKKLVTQLNGRLEAQKGGEQTLYLVIQGLQRARDLRTEMNSYAPDEEDSSSPNELFVKLLREGPEAGAHVLTWCDAYPNVARILSGRAIAEFGRRVATAMSSDDSSQLLDDTIAAKLDKPHRAIFYDEERPGYLEKFRPYGIPDRAWLERIAERLHARADK